MEYAMYPVLINLLQLNLWPFGYRHTNRGDKPGN